MVCNSPVDAVIYGRIICGPVDVEIVVKSAVVYGRIIGPVYVVTESAAVYRGIIGGPVDIVAENAAVYDRAVVDVVIYGGAVYDRSVGPIGVTRTAVYRIVPNAALYIVTPGQDIARVRGNPGSTACRPSVPSQLVAERIAGRIAGSRRGRRIAVPKVVVIIVHGVYAAAVITAVEIIGARPVVISVIIISAVIVGARTVIKASVYIISKVFTCAVAMVILRHIARAARNGDHTGGYRRAYHSFKVRFH